MTFYDDDLKRLKDKIDESNTSGSYVALEKTIPFLHALLARLEAAEKAIELVECESSCNCIASPSGHSIFDAKCMRCKILEAWRKAAGK